MRTVVLVSLVLAAGCDQSAFDLPDVGEPPPGPGSPTWDNTDLTCSTTDDCAPGETCEGSVCRPRQCDDGPYESMVPLGPRHVFFREQELLVADATANQGSYWLDGYDAAGTIAYGGTAGGSLSIGAAALVDVARIHTPGGEGVVVASAGSSSVTLAGRALPKKQVSVGIVPVAVAGGDVDGDAVDEIVALSASGRIAICEQQGGCDEYAFGNGETGMDIAAADVDGDRVAEVLFLLRTGDTTTIAAWTIGVDTSFRAASFATHFDAITAGDIDRDGRAEVAVLEDRGWFGLASDRVHVYRVGAGFQGLTAIATTRSAVDLAAGDLDGSDRGDSIVVLGDNKTVDVLRWSGSTLVHSFGGSVSTTSAPKRIAVADFDNSSVSARLVSGPELAPGRLLPTMVVTFPPFNSALSDTAGPRVSVGNTDEQGEQNTDTISLSAGVEVGVGADFAGIFKAQLSTKLASDVSRSRSLAHRTYVGTKFTLKPQTELYGNQYAAVVVACNCFHTYTYEMIDPQNRAGGTGRRFTMIVPVGGQTTVLSTPRYNALAEALGELPAITVPTRIGDVASYPRAPQKLDGSPVLPDEHVFATRPTLRVSDVGAVGFSLLVSDSETNTVALQTSVSVGGSIGALGLTVGGSLGVGWGKSYAVTIGKLAEFSGEIPPMPDRADTQEDEYVTHGYSFSPYVYRQPYVDTASGEKTGYYVLDYAVGAP